MSRRSTRWQPTMRRSLAVIAAIGLTAATAACAGQASARPAHTRAALVVRVAGGQLRGKTAGGTDEYLGIPYAAPPVGPLRWGRRSRRRLDRGIRTRPRSRRTARSRASPYGRATPTRTVCS